MSASVFCLRAQYSTGTITEASHGKKIKKKKRRRIRTGFSGVSVHLYRNIIILETVFRQKLPEEKPRNLVSLVTSQFLTAEQNDSFLSGSVPRHACGRALWTWRCDPGSSSQRAADDQRGCQNPCSASAGKRCSDRP